MDAQGFLNAEAAPITTAKTMPRPAPREAPTAADVNEFSLAFASRVASMDIARSYSNSMKSLSLASSFSSKMGVIVSLNFKGVDHNQKS